MKRPRALRPPRSRLRIAIAVTATLAARLGGAEGAERAAVATHADLADLDIAGPRPALLALAEEIADRYLGEQAMGEHAIAQPQLLTIIDYSLPSTEPRLWVVDRARRRVVFHVLVAHGRGSGENYATSFSNRDGSLQSSLGLFLTEETYVGRNGYSLRLHGLEPGFNDRARQRAVVMHGAPYVSAEFARQHGRLGRSWGCPALDPAIARTLIDVIRDGSLLFVYAPDASWLEGSAYRIAEAAPALAGGAGVAGVP